MGTFSYTTVKPKKLSMGNRVGYLYKLINVQTTGSRLTTPFKKITGYLIQTLSPVTADITVTSNTEGDHSQRASLIFAVNAEAQGYIIVVGLL